MQKHKKGIIPHPGSIVPIVKRGKEWVTKGHVASELDGDTSHRAPNYPSSSATVLSEREHESRDRAWTYQTIPFGAGSGICHIFFEQTNEAQSLSRLHA